ncbi:hypothetical protein [Comamonas sp.]|uniref:hypothetical protein n=1 Tax=Comamonas sp. TaxID=34028 RepID=UPI0025BC74D5|nr:hypothetical protein [Comamonas sp.]
MQEILSGGRRTAPKVLQQTLFARILRRQIRLPQPGQHKQHINPGCGNGSQVIAIRLSFVFFIEQLRLLAHTAKLAKPFLVQAKAFSFLTQTRTNTHMRNSILTNVRICVLLPYPSQTSAAS